MSESPVFAPQSHFPSHSLTLLARVHLFFASVRLPNTLRTNQQAKALLLPKAGGLATGGVGSGGSVGVGAGLNAGDRALLVFPPGLDFIVAFYGCLVVCVRRVLFVLAEIWQCACPFTVWCSCSRIVWITSIAEGNTPAVRPARPHVPVCVCDCFFFTSETRAAFAPPPDPPTRCGLIN